jgi:hypothetical protein
MFCEDDIRVASNRRGSTRRTPRCLSLYHEGEGQTAVIHGCSLAPGHTLDGVYRSLDLNKAHIQLQKIQTVGKRLAKIVSP